MSKHQKIKDTFLHELTASEERAKRAIKLLQYQDSKIGKLESVLRRKEQDISKLSANQQREQALAVQDYEMIQRELQTVRDTLRELHRVQQNWMSENEALRQASIKSQPTTASTPTPTAKAYSDDASRPREVHAPRNASPKIKTNEAQVQTQEPLAAPRTEPQRYSVTGQTQSPSPIEEIFKNFSQELCKINEKLDQRQASETDINHKLDFIHDQVEYLKEERDVVKSQVTQLNSRYKNIEGVILDLHSGVLEPDPASDYKPAPTTIKLRHEPVIWRTARRFFSPEEADHFLSALPP